MKLRQMLIHSEFIECLGFPDNFSCLLPYFFSSTDTLIQQTIRVKFANCSVLTVAHRLHTIMDSDRVLVMDLGKAVEFAAPHELMQTKNGIFYEMVHALGPQEVDRLTKIAAEKFKTSR